MYLPGVAFDDIEEGFANMSDEVPASAERDAANAGAAELNVWQDLVKTLLTYSTKGKGHLEPLHIEGNSCLSPLFSNRRAASEYQAEMNATSLPSVVLAQAKLTAKGHLGKFFQGTQAFLTELGAPTEAIIMSTMIAAGRGSEVKAKLSERRELQSLSQELIGKLDEAPKIGEMQEIRIKVKDESGAKAEGKTAYVLCKDIPSQAADAAGREAELMQLQEFADKVAWYGMSLEEFHLPSAQRLELLTAELVGFDVGE